MNNQREKSRQEDLFPNVVGQYPAKRKFEFYIKGFERTGIVPNILLTAPKGAGKTMLARAFARNLVIEDVREIDDVLHDVIVPKRYLEFNCATIKNLRQFVEQIMVPYMQGGSKATFLFDECHMLPKDVTMALLTITNPNKNNFNTFSYEGSDIDIDFRKLTFIFATTEPQDLFPNFIDCMERIDLDDYSHDELAQILMLNTEGIKFSGDVVAKHIAPTLRGNGRSAQRMATNIEDYCEQYEVSSFSLKDWNILCEFIAA